jgi:hypothetical protein
MIDGEQTLSVVLQGGFRNLIDLGPAPQLDAFQYALTARPASAKRRAWAKLQECERRLSVADWAMQGTDPVTGKNRTLAEDLVTAMFYSVEATIQVLKEEVDGVKGRGAFDQWLSLHPSHSLTLRAVRTIRHFSVHVAPLEPASSLEIPLFPRPSEPFVRRKWLLPEITPPQLGSLRNPKITLAELPAWNALRAKEPASALLQRVLRDLYSIVLDSETQL